MRRRWLSYTILAAGLAAAAVHAQRMPRREMPSDRGDGLPGLYAIGQPPSARCPRVRGEIKVDGALEDAGWRGVPNTATFLNANGKGLPAYPTVARLAWDYRSLYVGILCKDADITSPFGRRDDPLPRADVAGILLNLEDFPHRYVEIAVSPANVIADARISHAGPDAPPGIERTWDARHLRTATRVDGTLNERGDRDRGWTLEMAIPLPSLGMRRPPEPGEAWRVNLYRIDRGADSSFALWSPLLGDRAAVYQPERFGFLTITD